MKPLKAWFLPSSRDVLALLRSQLDTVDQVLEVVGRWVRGDIAAERAVPRLRELVLTEQAQRRDLHAAVRASFSTPLEAEDIFELGERLGEQAESAYALVREADLSATPPDPPLRDMVVATEMIRDPLGRALRALPDTAAAGYADQAIDNLATVEHAYRAAIADLENEPDLRREVRRRELYQRADHLARRCELVARRTWYAVCKSQ
ncbi:hypothetical protein [Actinokineospora sp. HUAS TT18]|uniref:hypothetical protein n=1 Tax=Actinokineospora sp. HUAS TT18 TaxID=3447451 RepID=UPI003F5243EF